MDSSAHGLQDSPTGATSRDDRDDDVVMEDAREPSPAESHGSSHYEEDDLNAGDIIANEDHDSDPDYDLDSDPSDNDDDEKEEDVPTAKSTKRPIEVVLRPPSNASDYERVDTSQIVESIQGETKIGRILYLTVKFLDGDIDEVAYDDLLQMENGPNALRQYQPQRFNLNGIARDRLAGKRSLSEDNYLESDSEGPKRYQKRPKSSTQSIRRSARQASIQMSRRASSDDDEDVNGFDERFGDNSDEDSNGDFDGGVQRAKVAKSKGRQAKLTFSSTERITRSMDPVWRGQRAQDNSEDELAQGSDSDQDDEYDDAIPIIRSDLGGTSRTSLRKKRKSQARRRSVRYVDSDSEIEFEPTRKSQRSNKISRSMRVPGMDDDYEAIEEVPAAPKIAAVKETFEECPDESDFRRAHSETCDTCGLKGHHSKGALIPCQGCSYSFHKHCIGVRSQRDHRATKVDSSNFVLQCKYCIGVYQKKDQRAPNYAKCQVCKHPGVSCAEFSHKKTPKQEEHARLQNGGEDPITHVQPNLVNSAGNVLFRCSDCKRAYHFEHLPPLTSNTMEALSIRDDRLDEYSLVGWKCKDCLDAHPKIHALVAWRPADQSTYTKGQLSDEFNVDQIEYLVKWDGRSHYHDIWMPGAWVYGTVAPATRIAFHKRDGNEAPKMTTESAIEEEWLCADVLLGVRFRRGSTASSKSQDLARISDVVSIHVKFQGLSYEEVVWDEPPPRDSGARWLAFAAAYDEFMNGKYFKSASDQQLRERINRYRSLDFQKDCELKSQPANLSKGRTLMEYQMEGVNWLLYNFHQQQNVILADEMGLGKTIQIVSFISSLVQDQPKCWPFLIVVPNSTCPNWRRELKAWAPGIRVVAYHGGKASQDLAYQYELFPNGLKDGMKAHVVIMSYEAATSLKSAFRSIKWTGLIVDEGQRLKNDETALYKTLTEMKIPCRVLLTGTPLQNNKRELFNLLQFVDPQNNAEELDIKYSELTKENVPEIHNLIRPYFLRRTKLQVLKFLPPMAQVIVPVTMTLLQEKLSKTIMAKKPELLKAIISKGKINKGDRKALSNIMMDLRQCLCHPFCFNSEVEDKSVSEQQMHRNLIEASPKLKLLEIMLPKLKEKGHRVLIFSQFLGCLDIIEDFLNVLGLQHGRIDGKISALKKQKQIDAFNAPDSSLFAMLLSTRAGGVGINLATADTVIIYDPDWNPHQDIQAISRAHRIGQKEKVLCFQLTTKNTIEEEIMQTGKKKMALDHALIESLDMDSGDDHDIESILRRGAEALFSDQDKVKITYDSASVNKLLDRSKVENTNANDQTAETQFSVARVWANDSGTLADNVDRTGDNDAPVADSSVWENILKVREEEHRRQVAAQQAEYGRGARRRGTQGVNYSGDPVGFLKDLNILSDEEEDNVDLTEEQRPDPESGGSDVDAEDELYIDNGIDDDFDDKDDEVDDDADEDGAQVHEGEKQGLVPAESKGAKGKRSAPATPSESPKKKAKTTHTTTSNSTQPSSGNGETAKNERNGQRPRTSKTSSSKHKLGHSSDAGGAAN